MEKNKVVSSMENQDVYENKELRARGRSKFLWGRLHNHSLGEGCVCARAHVWKEDRPRLSSAHRRQAIAFVE